MKIALIPELAEAAIRAQKATKQTRQFIRDVIVAELTDSQARLAETLTMNVTDKMIAEIRERERALTAPPPIAPMPAPRTPILFADEGYGTLVGLSYEEANKEASQ